MREGIWVTDEHWWSVDEDGRLEVHDTAEEAKAVAHRALAGLEPNGEISADWEDRVARVAWGKLEAYARAKEGPRTYHSEEAGCCRGPSSAWVEGACEVCDSADGEWEYLVGSISLKGTDEAETAAEALVAAKLRAMGRILDIHDYGGIPYPDACVIAVEGKGFRIYRGPTRLDALKAALKGEGGDCE